MPVARPRRGANEAGAQLIGARHHFVDDGIKHG